MAKGLTFNVEMLTQMGSAKDTYAKRLVELAQKNKNIFLVCADNASKGSNQARFRELLPQQFHDVGIAESNAVGFAAGLALSGKIVYVQAFGPFLSLRCVDQIHTDIAYNDVQVRIIGTHGGLTSGGGPTHFTIADYAIMRAIPNMTMVVPADANQCTKLIEESVTYSGPMYIRMARGEEPLVYETQDYDYKIGRAVTVKEGTDATIIGCGVGVFHGVTASNLLAKEGISTRVIDMHTLKPIDKDAVLKAATETKAIVTVEDHNIIGGLGDAVASVIAEANVSVKFKRAGIPDVFSALGYHEELYAHYQYDGPGLVKHVKSLLGD